VGLTFVTVRFNNVNGNGGVSVSVTDCNSACNSSGGGGTASLTPVIRYLGAIGNIKLNGSGYSGSQSVTCNTTNITVSVDAVTNATNYNWSVPSGWSFSGSGSSITVTPSLNTQGTIQVVATRSDVSDTYLSSTASLGITRPLPVINSISISSMLLCSGTTQSLSATGTNQDKFEWAPSGNIRVDGNASTQTVSGSVNIGAVGAGTFTVKAYSTSCAVTSTNSVSATVRYGPPVIGYPVMTLMDAGSNMYQLSYDNQSYAPVTSVYTVVSGSASMIPNSNDCYASSMDGATIECVSTNSCGNSSAYSFVIPPAGGFLISVFPNPASESLTLEFRNVEIENFLPESISLISSTSRLAVKKIDTSEIFNKQAFTNGKKLNIDLRGLPKGIYYLHITPRKDSKQKMEKIQVKVE